MNELQQVDWTPPVKTGLTSDDVYLSERIENHASSPTEAHNPGVYVLELSLPKGANSNEKYERLWLSGGKEAIPPYMPEIVNAQRLLYVGSSYNCYERIREHIDASDPDKPSKSTTIASVFPIHSIVDIDFCESKDAAAEKEHARGIELAYEEPTAYVHHR